MGGLNVEALEKALNVIVARHEILRTTIQVLGERTIAVVHETNGHCNLRQIDLSGCLPLDRREAEVERLLVDEPRRAVSSRERAGNPGNTAQLGPMEHVLILMMHHIICDWSSVGVIWRELSALYRAVARQALLCLPCPFSTAITQHGSNSNIGRGEVCGGPGYWEETLRGAPALLELPTDGHARIAASYRGARKRRFAHRRTTGACCGD